MTNNCYKNKQTNKQTNKEACERYQDLSEQESTKGEKSPKNDIKILLKTIKNVVRIFLRNKKETS